MIHPNLTKPNPMVTQSLQVSNTNPKTTANPNSKHSQQPHHKEIPSVIVKPKSPKFYRTQTSVNPKVKHKHTPGKSIQNSNPTQTTLSNHKSSGKPFKMQCKLQNAKSHKATGKSRKSRKPQTTIKPTSKQV